MWPFQVPTPIRSIWDDVNIFLILNSVLWYKKWTLRLKVSFLPVVDLLDLETSGYPDLDLVADLALTDLEHLTDGQLTEHLLVEEEFLKENVTFCKLK